MKYDENKEMEKDSLVMIVRTKKGDFEHCYVVCMDNRSNEESDGSRRCRSGLLGLGKAPPKR